MSTAVQILARVEKLRQLAADGLTLKESSDRIGVSYQMVRRYAVDFDLPFRKGYHYTARGDRSERMAQMYQSGCTLEAIGRDFGITRERVRQIITKHHGLTRENGGQALLATARRQAISVKLDAACMRRYGCTMAQWREVLRIGREMMKGGVGRERTPLGAFQCQRANAHARGVGWELTFWDWWTFWQRSGKWDQRGRGNGYVMSRIADAGPYKIGNIFIQTGAENSSRRAGKVHDLPRGVHRMASGRYRASRMVAGQKYWLGVFDCPEKAHAAYLAGPRSREAS